MINLIPNEEKKKIAHHFYSRLTILSFIMLGFSMCFAILAILPSYILSEAKENLVNEKLAVQKAEPVPILDQNTASAIADLDSKLTLAEKLEKPGFVVTERVIKEVLKSKMSNIKITQISYENDPTAGQKISVDGEAPSREALLSFRQSLEDNPAFQKVDLPISNFVKGSNIQFHLNLIPAI